MDNEQLRLIYSNLIAGKLPCGAASPVKVVMHQAQAILGTNRLHVHVVEKGGFLYYFAIESRHLSSVDNFVLPFADALPDAAGHQGDGIYLLRLSGFSVAMILERGSLSVMCNETEVLNDYLLGFDLPQYPVDQLVGKPLRSIPQAILGVSEKVGRAVFWGSLATMASSLLVFVVVQALQVYSVARDDGQTNARAIEADLNATIGKLNVQQPLARQISRVQKVSATVIRSGGWIEKYSLKDEDHESFELVLPSWVSQDYLDSLGRDVVTDLRDTEGLLTVRKLEKGKKKS